MFRSVLSRFFSRNVNDVNRNVSGDTLKVSYKSLIKSFVYRFSRELISLYVFITLIMCPYLDDKLNYFVDCNEFACFYLFAFTFLTRLLFRKFYIYRNKNLGFSKDGNSNILINFRVFFMRLKSINFFNFLIVNLKKVFSFFRFNVNFSNFSNFFKKHFSVISWRPLFKRWSYYGNYKSRK